MLDKLNNRYKRQNTCIFAFVFVIFFIIFWLAPISGDDWPRYAYLDTPLTFTKLFQSMRRDYLHLNGRVVGNTISKLLMAPDLLRTLSKTLITFGIYLCIAYLTETNRKSGLTIIFLLMMLMPIEIFREAYSWSAGFFNYVPPVLIILTFMVVMKRLRAERGKETKALLIGTFLLGTVASLFAEHITVFNVVMFIGLVFVLRIVCKKWIPAAVCYMAGAVVGAIVMFLSPVYRSVLNESDAYRDVAINSGEVIDKIFKNFPVISDFSLGKLYVVLVTLAISLILLNLKQRPKSLLDKISIGICIWTPGYFIITNTFIAGQIDSGSNGVILVDLIIFTLLGIVFFRTIKKFLKKEVRLQMFFLSSGVIVLVVPLLFVSPISARLFYIVYIFLILIIVRLLSYANAWSHSEKQYPKILLSTLAILVAGIYIAINLDIRKGTEKRDGHIARMMLRQESTIEIPECLHADYIHQANRDAAKIGEKFYYNEPGDIAFIYIPVYEWESKYD